VAKRRVKMAGHAAASITGTYAFQGNIQYPRAIEEVYVVAGNEAFVFHFECFSLNAETYLQDLSAVYASFERGWALLYVIPANGGESVRVTRDTTNVYHGGALWVPGDSLLVVGALDLEANRDAGELWTYRLSDGSWNRLTRTLGFEGPQAFTPDGKDILTILGTERRQIKRVTVADLVGGRQ